LSRLTSKKVPVTTVRPFLEDAEALEGTRTEFTYSKTPCIISLTDNVNRYWEVIPLQDKIVRKLFLGFIQIHILHHAAQEPFYGSWMLEELQSHGYSMSPGTLYPLLHSLEEAELITREDQVVEGRVRKYYGITEIGEQVLEEAKIKARELFREID
jgi:DNA-binding PadR family transcriptional regulator